MNGATGIITQIPGIYTQQNQSSTLRFILPIGHFKSQIYYPFASESLNPLPGNEPVGIMVCTLIYFPGTAVRILACRHLSFNHGVL